MCRSHVIRVLLDAGATPRACCALHMAAGRGRGDVIELLVRHGAELAARDPEGWTPFDRALMIGQGDGKSAVHLLLDMNAPRHPGWDLLNWAAREGDLGLASRLLDEGEVVDALGPETHPQAWGEATPLYQAASQGHEDLVELLLANRSDPSLGNAIGWTPLHIAVNNDDIGVVGLLLAAGSDVNARSDDPHTPLSLARQRAGQEMIELIEANGGVE